ncbi:hypothetical protein D3C80_164290 [compost metagenome]
MKFVYLDSEGAQRLPLISVPLSLESPTHSHSTPLPYSNPIRCIHAGRPASQDTYLDTQRWETVVK